MTRTHVFRYLEDNIGLIDARDNILRICKEHDVDAVLPGYGFLSENAAFAQQVAEAGMVFGGPSPETITEMGLKHRSRELATATKVPVVPGTGLLENETAAIEEAKKLGFPVCYDTRALYSILLIALSR